MWDNEGSVQNAFLGDLMAQRCRLEASRWATYARVIWCRRNHRVTLKAVHDMLISLVIPAFNEKRYLPETLSSLREAISLCRCSVELIVVDNDSVDRTADVARSFGAIVVHEAVHNISRVRNAGAGVARGDVLAFVDADTIVPPY